MVKAAADRRISADRRMPGVLLNNNDNKDGHTSSSNVQWIDQQQYLIQTYRDIRASLSQLENEIDAARLRVSDWSSHRPALLSARSSILSVRRLHRQQNLAREVEATAAAEVSATRSRSMSTGPGSSVLSCCSRDSEMTESSCPTTFSSASSAGNDMSFNAATLLTAFLMATTSASPPPQDTSTSSNSPLISTRASNNRRSSSPCKSR
ncbi:hypothetical protein Ciccas_009012 [Cichlidogyrus casuarinus]|uniref:Uncharacterized protein n=1 Tax=Cichlidogyrus casuarinus TaxID=1844966 RepID=A0ABD2PZP5_9PLAT